MSHPNTRQKHLPTTERDEGGGLFLPVTRTHFNPLHWNIPLLSPIPQEPPQGQYHAVYKNWCAHIHSSITQIAMQARSLDSVGAETRVTAGMICSLHKDWLGGIYPWAGHYRNVELAKGGFRWPPAYLVPRHMAGFESGLLAEYTPCRPAPLPEVATRIAMVHAELLLIHPFRDGNGRLARWVAALMAVQAGYPLPEFRFAGRKSRKESDDYLASVQKGYAQDYFPLADFFENAIRRRMEEGS